MASLAAGCAPDAEGAADRAIPPWRSPAAGARPPETPPGRRGKLTLTYLLDTSVVSELRRAKPHGGVVAWLNGIADNELYLSAVTIGEIQGGIEKAREQDPGKARDIEAWLEQIAETFNVLPMDARAFRAWARLMHHRSDALIEDAMIAATAEIHGMTVVTRNSRDFRTLGVATIDPFHTAR